MVAYKYPDMVHGHSHALRVMAHAISFMAAYPVSHIKTALDSCTTSLVTVEQHTTAAAQSGEVQFSAADGSHALLLNCKAHLQRLTVNIWTSVSQGEAAAAEGFDLSFSSLRCSRHATIYCTCTV